MVQDTTGQVWEFFSNGRYTPDGEVLLFPSTVSKDWSTFKIRIERWDPDTLKPYDKVLGRDWDDVWHLDFYATSDLSGIICVSGTYDLVIPYNDDHAGFLNTQDDPTEYYKWWENE